MVERVMDFAGMSSGTLMRGTRPTDVKQVLSAVVAALQADAHERNLALHLRAAADLPLVDGDADALRSALQNAIGNAVKYSPANTTIEIDLVASTRALRVTVNDRGIGIDASDLPHVFEPFYRGRRAVDAQIRGSGVGLSVVRKVVDAHGGDVGIASREGGGTTLTIELPVPRPSHASGE
jgi:signal transduction histidine kinase